MSLPEIQKPTGKEVWRNMWGSYIYAYAKKAKNRKINEKGGDKQKKQES